MDCLNSYTGKIVKASADKVWVKVVKPTACGGCKACAMFSGDKSVVLPVINTINANLGDEVEITAPKVKPMLGTLLLLLLPLALLVLGIVVGYLTGVGDGFTALIAIGFAGVGFCITLVLDRLVFTKKYSSQTIKILKNTHIGEEL